MWSLVVFSATLIDENTALTKWLNWIWFEFEFVWKYMTSNTEKIKEIKLSIQKDVKNYWKITVNAKNEK